MTERTVDDCGVTVERSGEPEVVLVGPPYRAAFLGEPQPAIGLKMLLTMLDGTLWPLQNCGDHSVGTGAAGNGWGLVDPRFATYAEIDAGPALGDAFPADPPTYPGVGITAYGCEIDCDYIITGDLGAEVIVGKIDGQWHILRVTGSASTIPLTGSHNECRCCGSSRKKRKMRAEILTVSASCSEYPVGTEFVLDPITSSDFYNPLRLSLSCRSTADSPLEDITDWTAYACGNEAEMVSLSCCAPVEDSGTSGADECRFEAVIRTTAVEGCSDCVYEILIYDEPGDPCVEFEDEEFGLPVVMEACGLPDLPVGTRVIMARIPRTAAGRDELSGEDPVEWFVVRACTEEVCADQCDPPPPQGPPCCGVLCSEMPNGLTATVEILASDCCGGSLALGLTKEGAETECDSASDTKWFLYDLTSTTPPENIICSGTSSGSPAYPTKVAINNLELLCGSAEDLCGSESGSGSPTEGPLFSLWVSYYETYSPTGAIGRVMATQNREVSCCSPLYLEFEITIPVCYIAGAGVIIASTTLKITITE